jgi:chorismate mutase
MTKTITTNELQHLTINVDGDLVRDEIMNGEEYWVAPLVMMTECVANGSSGSLFYPGEELERWSPAWNHKPIVSPNHPEEGSACTQKFLDEHGIGVVLSANWDGKQRALGWFNKKQTEKKEPRVANALKTRKMMELSTGLYVDKSGEPGIFKGEKYDAIAINHRPDHLAILPDKIGACSIKKGAGLLQLNEASHETLRNQLEHLVCVLYKSQLEEMPSLYSPYVREVYDSYCIFYFAGNTFKISYQTSSSDKVSLVGDPTKVVQKVEYVPVKNTDQEKEISMATKELIDKVIANSSKTNFEEGDRKHLEGLTDDRLKKIIENAEKEVKPKFGFTSQKELDEAVARGLEEAITKDPTAIKEKAEAAVQNSKKSDQKESPKKEMTPEEWMASIPTQFRPVMNNAMKALSHETDSLVKTITSNENNKFKAEDLVKMDIDLLRNMAALVSAPKQDHTVGQSFGSLYAGLGPLLSSNSDTKEQGLPLPVYNNEKFSQAAVK